MNASATLLNALGVVFGLAWVWVNVYLHYPLVKATVRRCLRGITFPVEPPRDDRREDATIEGHTAMDGGTDLPSSTPLEFDVLLPAYAESRVIENSIASVRNADYDQTKINLVVLTEPDDDASGARPVTSRE